MNELAELWVSASTDVRSEITTAAAEIDRLLVTSPLEIGESRLPGVRVAFVNELAVEYYVLLDDQRVTISV